MSECGHGTVCRCEEISQDEIIDAIKNGYTTLDAIKKKTRAGMGFCQGKICKRLVAQLIAAYGNIPIDIALEGSVRMPVGPISLELIANTVDGLEEEE